MPHVLLVKCLEVRAQRCELSKKVIDIGPSDARDDAVQRSDVLPQLTQRCCVGSRLFDELSVERIAHVVLLE